MKFTLTTDLRLTTFCEIDSSLYRILVFFPGFGLDKCHYFNFKIHVYNRIVIIICSLHKLEYCSHSWQDRWHVMKILSMLTKSCLSRYSIVRTYIINSTFHRHFSRLICGKLFLVHPYATKFVSVQNCIGGVMVSVVTPGAADLGSKPVLLKPLSVKIVFVASSLSMH